MRIKRGACGFGSHSVRSFLAHLDDDAGIHHAMCLDGELHASTKTRHAESASSDAV
jgi:hypothetical protein